MCLSDKASINNTLIVRDSEIKPSTCQEDGVSQLLWDRNCPALGTLLDLALHVSLSGRFSVSFIISFVINQ